MSETKRFNLACGHDGNCLRTLPGPFGAQVCGWCADVAKEREKAREEERACCATLADLIRDDIGGSTGNAEGTGRAIAAAIRARGIHA